MNGSAEPYYAELRPRVAQPVERQWTDLSTNRPGELVRQRAIEERRRAPVKTALARGLQVHTDERAWRVGADGEETVGRRLAKLPEPWRVLHSVPVGNGSSDIDHVVIGPGGVFTINTKNHPNKKVWVSEKCFMVDGHRTEYLRNSRFEATRATNLLSAACGRDVAVEPMIVVLAGTLTTEGRLDTVVVLAPRAAERWLRRRPARLSPPEVATVFEQARRSTTWRSTVEPPTC